MRRCILRTQRRLLARLLALDPGNGVTTGDAGSPAALLRLRARGFVRFVGHDRWQITDRGRMQLAERAAARTHAAAVPVSPITDHTHNSEHTSL